MSKSIYSLSRFFPQLLLATRSMSTRSVVSALQSVWQLLTQPKHYVELAENSAFSTPYTLLVLSLLISLPRFMFDPNVDRTADLLHLPGLFHSLYVLLFALGSAIGSMLVPMFWHRVLGIRIERDVFVAAMITMYAVVEIPWDLSSVFWLFSVRNGTIGFWIPDAVKTIIVTVYCTYVGERVAHASLHR